LTFADAAEKGGNGDSGHSQVAIIDLGMVLAERLHPKAAYSRCRPIPAHRRAPMLPDDRPGCFTFRIREAAVRDLRRSATSRHWPVWRKADLQLPDLPIRPYAPAAPSRTMSPSLATGQAAHRADQRSA